MTTFYRSRVIFLNNVSTVKSHYACAGIQIFLSSRVKNATYKLQMRKHLPIQLCEFREIKMLAKVFTQVAHSFGTCSQLIMKNPYKIIIICQQSIGWILL